jgi:hypothetical protein
LTDVDDDIVRTKYGKHIASSAVANPSATNRRMLWAGSRRLMKPLHVPFVNDPEMFGETGTEFEDPTE